MTNIDGHCHLALIDSGCELSLAPSTIVGDRVLRPVPQGVFAANGSAIFVQGETEIEMNLGGYVSSATVLVSPVSLRVNVGNHVVDSRTCSVGLQSSYSACWTKVLPTTIQEILRHLLSCVCRP